MPLHDTHYQHWDGVHCGLWAPALGHCQKRPGRLPAKQGACALWSSSAGWRVGHGRGSFSGRPACWWPTASWSNGSRNLNPALQAFARMLTSWLQDHPEISVRTTQNVLFYFFGIFLMPLSIFALGMAMPAVDHARSGQQRHRHLFLQGRDAAAIICWGNSAPPSGCWP